MLRVLPYHLLILPSSIIQLASLRPKEVKVFFPFPSVSLSVAHFHWLPQLCSLREVLHRSSSLPTCITSYPPHSLTFHLRGLCSNTSFAILKCQANWMPLSRDMMGWTWSPYPAQVGLLCSHIAHSLAQRQHQVEIRPGIWKIGNRNIISADGP